MLRNFPSDFRYILGLQEASVVGMADGYAQASRMPTVAIVHSAAGIGNAMGNIATAFLNKSPLVLIAGNQAREYLVGDPLLTDRDSTILTKPWTKWSYEPANAEAVPAALSRAIAMASQPPAGPVFLSIPFTDFFEEAGEEPAIRTVSTTVAPDPTRLAEFAARIGKAKRLALVYGEEVDYSLGWEAAIALAELLKAPVFSAPLQARAVFPFNNPLYQGPLPLAQGPVGEALAHFDLVLVVGATVFRYYPYQSGPVLQNGTELLQITNDPHDAAAARVGDSMLSDARLALEALYQLLRSNSTSSPSSTSSNQTAASPPKSPPKNSTNHLMTAAQAFEAAALARQKSDLLVQESPSNVEDLLTAWPIIEQATYFTSASGFLGWGLPAAVGIAMAQTNRSTVLALGDGSMQYSVQAIYTAVQHKAKLIILVPRNEEYAILKEFAIFEKTPNCRKYHPWSHMQKRN